MPFVCVQSDLSERIFGNRPMKLKGKLIKHCDWHWPMPSDEDCFYGIELTPGTIRLLIGRDLKHEDEPVEITPEVISGTEPPQMKRSWNYTDEHPDPMIM